MSVSAPSRLMANLFGFAATGLWGALALMTTLTGTIPPFQLTALTFGIGGIAASLVVAARGGLSLMRQPPLVWLHGVAGLFGYHALYFFALRYAPAAEANLINYLWPLLIVLFSAFLPGEKLLVRHVLGAGIGLAGTALMVILGKGLGGAQSSHALIGYLAALGCAFWWSTYSVTARLFPAVPTEAVTGFCLMTAFLAAVMSAVLETPVWPDGASGWLAVAALGLGPVAGSFFLWDAAMKHGNVQLLGTLAYAAPVLSTLMLMLFGKAEPSSIILFAAAMIVLGALVSSWDAIRPLLALYILSGRRQK